MRLWHFFCSVTGLILWILVIIRAHPHRRTRQKVGSLFQQTKTHFDVDHSPILRTETVEAWSDKKEPEGNDADGNEEVDEAQVSNDDEGTVGLPSKAEKAPEVLIEKEENHIVWGMWGPWSPCSGSCGPGHTRKRIRKCARGACHDGVVEEQVESCNGKPCQADIRQAATKSTFVLFSVK